MSSTRMDRLGRSEKAVLYALWHAGGTITVKSQRDWTEWEKHLPLQMSRASIRIALDSLNARQAVQADMPTGPTGKRRLLKMARLTDFGYRWCDREPQVFAPIADNITVPYDQRPLLRSTSNPNTGLTKGSRRASAQEFCQWFWDKYGGETVSKMIDLSREFNGSRHKAATVEQHGYLASDPASPGNKNPRRIWLTNEGLALVGGEPNQAKPEPVVSDVSPDEVAAALLDQLVAKIQATQHVEVQIAAADQHIAELQEQVTRLETQLANVNGSLSTMTMRRDELSVENARLRRAQSISAYSAAVVEQTAQRLGRQT